MTSRQLPRESKFTLDLRLCSTIRLVLPLYHTGVDSGTHTAGTLCVISHGETGEKLDIAEYYPRLPHTSTRVTAQPYAELETLHRLDIPACSLSVDTTGFSH